MKLTKKLRNKLLAGAVSLSSLALAGTSNALVQVLCGSGGPTSNCDIQALTTNMSANVHSMTQMFYLGAGIIGVAMIVIGLLKLKAHSMDSQGTSGHLRTAIWLLIIGALMLSIPVIMMLGSTSITGNTVQMTSESGLFT
jgi:hypothetical protein